MIEKSGDCICSCINTRFSCLMCSNYVSFCTNKEGLAIYTYCDS